MPVTAFLIGYGFGVVSLAVAILACQRLAKLYPPIQRQPRLTVDPRIGYRNQLAELRRQHEREHPEDYPIHTTGGLWH